MSKQRRGKLIIIGGHEDKKDDEAILKTVVESCGSKPLVVVTVATHEPEKVAAEYTRIFQDLGVSKVEVVDIRVREDGFAKENVAALKQAGCVFFTGGDQLRITSQIGDSDVYSTMRDIFERGATIAGTSAGAAAMPETM